MHGAHERGAGIFGSAFGLTFFLVFLLLAIQLLWSLYATSVVTSAAYDAGRLAARTGDAEAGVARFERSVGSYEADVTIAVPAGEGVVVVDVTGANPTLLPDRWARALPFGTIDRSIEIRREVFIEE